MSARRARYPGDSLGTHPAGVFRPVARRRIAATAAAEPGCGRDLSRPRKTIRPIIVRIIPSSLQDDHRPLTSLPLSYTTIHCARVVGSPHSHTPAPTPRPGFDPSSIFFCERTVKVPVIHCYIYVYLQYSYNHYNNMCHEASYSTPYNNNTRRCAHDLHLPPAV